MSRLTYPVAAALAALMAAFMFFCGYFCGALNTLSQHYYEKNIEERDLILPLLASNPEYSRLQTNDIHSKSFVVFGQVASDDIRLRLIEEITRLVGGSRAKSIVCVTVDAKHKRPKE